MKFVSILILLSVDLALAIPPYYNSLADVMSKIFDDEFERPIVKKEGVAHANIADQVRVREVNHVSLPVGSTGGEGQSVTRLQDEWLRVDRSDAELGPLQVGHDCNRETLFLGNATDRVDIFRMLLFSSVREVDPRYIHPSTDQRAQRLFVA